VDQVQEEELSRINIYGQDPLRRFQECGQSSDQEELHVG
jgi:hypothetical protein